MSCIEYSDARFVIFSPTKMHECITLFGKDHSPFNVTLSKGTYKIELWGAAGGASLGGRRNKGGYGGYSSGLLTLYSQETFIFEVGTKGGDVLKDKRRVPGIAGYNGGAHGANDTVNNDCPSGGSGGSTDMRTNTSISSRIIVAGGGGSAGCYKQGGKGVNGGGIAGTPGLDSGNVFGGSPGTQTDGYRPLYGQPGTEGNEAGGSASGAGGGGGSSYISGHPKCILIEEYKFDSPITISGDNLMPSNASLHVYVVGNKGNGSVRITNFSAIITCSYRKHRIHIIYLLIVTIIPNNS